MALFQSAITIVVFLVMLGVLVLVHEVGHFVSARMANIRVLEFGIGFPPRARILRSTGETLYTLNWLPIGGFVKLEGEDGGDADDPRSFVRARLPVKVLVLAAGVLMNLVLAFLIFFSIAWLASPTGEIRFASVQAGSPAAGVGITPNDAIVAIDGRTYDFFDGPSTMVEDLRAHAGQTVVLGLLNGGRERNVTVTLRSPQQIDSEHGALGIVGGSQGLLFGPSGDYTQRDPVSAFQIGVQRTGSAFRLILDGLGQLGTSIVRNPTAAPPVTGPVGIAVTVGDVLWQLGPIFTLYLAGILSANLALVNILPFPPLDGGRILVLILQRLVGNRISQTAERLTYLVGFVFLFGFLIWITYFDIAREVTGGATP